MIKTHLKREYYFDLTEVRPPTTKCVAFFELQTNQGLFQLEFHLPRVRVEKECVPDPCQGFVARA